jgi:hypothetical protein
MAVDFSIMSKNNKFLESNAAAAIARDAIPGDNNFVIFHATPTNSAIWLDAC